jgi:RNA polymerase sigma-70 factor, ECF subfamily
MPDRLTDADDDPGRVSPLRGRGARRSEHEEEFVRRVYDEHAASLWSYALHLTRGDRRQAEDLVQETMLRAWRTPDLLSDEAKSARPWLFAVAKRIAIDRWRSRTARPEVITDSPPAEQRDETDQALQAWLVADAVGKLSLAHREVLVACFYEGRSVADAARHIGVPEGTVKSRSHYALRALRLALQEMGAI